jgi:hypothetical protein
MAILNKVFHGYENHEKLQNKKWFMLGSSGVIPQARP